MNCWRIENSLRRYEDALWFTPLCGLLATLFFMSPLAYFLYLPAEDARFNFWFTQFYSDAFASGIFIPDIINVTNNVSLNPLPAFYGGMLHFLAGVVNLLVTPHMACWIVLFVATWIQYSMTAYTLGTAIQSRAIGNMAACVVTFSSYAINNLCYRGALAEYLGASLSVTCACALLALCFQPEYKRQFILIAAAGFALICNIHALTMLYMSIFYLPLAIFALYLFVFKCKRKFDLPFLGIVFGLVLLSLLHFAYIVLKNPNTFITIYESTMQFDFIDNLLLRLSPLPVCFDLFGFNPKANLFCTQINMPLLFLSVILIWTSVVHGGKFFNGTRAWALPILAGLSVVVALFLTYISVYPTLFAPLYAVIKTGQFTFRLVQYVNFFCLLALALALYRLRGIRESNIFRLTGKCALLTSACVVLHLLQLYSQFFIDINRPKEIAECLNVEDTTTVHQCVYGFIDYATPNTFAQETAPEASRVVPLQASKQDNTVMYSAPTEVENGELLQFAVLPFNWNFIYVVNAETGTRSKLSYSQLRGTTWPRSGLYTNQIPAGRYVFEARFEAPLKWKIFRYIYPLAVLLLILGGLWSAGVLFLRSSKVLRSPCV